MASAFIVLADAIRERVRWPDGDIFWGTSRRGLVEHTGSTRVVWIRTGGNITRNVNPGRVRVEGVPEKFRPIYANEIDVEAHILADGNDAFERLHARILSATREVFGPASEPGRYAIETEAERAGVIRAGLVKGVQQFRWSVVVGQMEDASTGELSPGIPTRRLVTVTLSPVIVEIDHDLEV